MKIKQIVVPGKNQVELQDAEIPDTLEPKDVLIETDKTFISAGTELSVFTGLDTDALTPGNWCSYPYKSGYANVGHVLAVGSEVKQFKPGDRVYSAGKHASRLIMPTNRLMLQVPDGVPSDVAAASRMAAVSITSVHVSEKSYNRWVVVCGLGMVGNLAAQMFRIMGCRVIGVDFAQKRRELALQCDVHHAVGGSPEEVLNAIKDLTGGQMAQTAVDAVGDSRVILQCMKSVGKFGEVILLGTPRAEVQGNLTDAFKDSFVRWITIKGASEWRIPTFSSGPGAGESHYSKHVTIFDWIQRGELKLEPLISHTMKPEEINKAYDGLLNQKDTYTGVVLDWKGK